MKRSSRGYRITKFDGESWLCLIRFEPTTLPAALNEKINMFMGPSLTTKGAKSDEMHFKMFKNPLTSRHC